MPTLEEIQKQLEGLDGLSKFFGAKEIKELPSIMHNDEKLLGVAQGIFRGGQGLLAITASRLIFVDKGLFGGVKVVDFFYDKISSVSYKSGLVMSSIEIFVSGNKEEISNVEKAQGKTACEIIRNQLSSGKTVAMPSGQTIPIADEILKLASLVEKGLLTKEEFDAQKKKLLS